MVTLRQAVCSWRRHGEPKLGNLVRSGYYITKHRLQNRYADVRAVMAGYCNDRPWRPRPGDGGGYSHWRCALRGRHEGLHRFNNYVWTADGRADYLPIPSGARTPVQPWQRTGSPRMRDARVTRRWHEGQLR